MQRCFGCKHASWRRNAAGSLHPSGDGECTKEIKIPEPPACRRWLHEPEMSFPLINRKTELKRHCVYFEAKKG